MWLAALVCAAWANRQDLQRWIKFVRRAVEQRSTRPFTDVVTEMKVRAAVSIDPMMRRDPSLQDLSVSDGVVTLLTNTASWPDPRDQIWRLKKVKGITDVTATLTDTVAN